MAEAAADETPVPAGPALVVPAQVSKAQAPEAKMPESQAPGRPVQVQAPGHLRGTRSASFLAPSPPPAEPLLRGAELLMVGTGEEEAW
jgi:hypothetical protein